MLPVARSAGSGVSYMARRLGVGPSVTHGQLGCSLAPWSQDTAHMCILEVLGRGLCAV